MIHGINENLTFKIHILKRLIFFTWIKLWPVNRFGSNWEGYQVHPQLLHSHPYDIHYRPLPMRLFFKNRKLELSEPEVGKYPKQNLSGLFSGCSMLAPLKYLKFLPKWWSIYHVLNPKARICKWQGSSWISRLRTFVWVPDRIFCRSAKYGN